MTLIRPNELDVIISSSSDVESQRDFIEASISEWNRLQGAHLNIRLSALRWETMAGTSGGKAQPEINSQLVERADILVGIFWTRFGTPTENYQSGTEEEIELMLAAGKPVILYFLDKRPELKKIDPTQLDKINAFKKRYQDKGLYKIIKLNKLKNQLYIDLEFNAKKVLAQYNELSKKKKASKRIEKIKSDRGEELIIENHTSSLVDVSPSEEYWFELSIADLINQYLKEQNLNLAYRDGLTFIENISLWRSSSSGGNFDTIISLANKAREYAFGVKYGKYNYSHDLLSQYPKWYLPIHKVIENYNPHIGMAQILGVGSNCGIELEQIFSKKKTDVKLEVLDICPTAISLGKSIYKDNSIRFSCGNMEECHLSRVHYDVYLNLRAIHSNGVDIKSTVAECFGLLKERGIAIFSISNGYWMPKNPISREFFEVTGMLDRPTGLYSKDKPYYLANKVRRKLEEYGFRKTGIETGDAEVFVYGQK